MGISFSEISSRSKAKISLAVKILFSALVIGFIIARVDFSRVWESLLSANTEFIAFAVVLMLASLVIQFVKWKVIARKIIGETNNKTLLKSLLLGISSAMITPLQTGVYVGRAAAFEKEKIPRVIFATIFDKITMLFITAFLGSLVSLLFLKEKYDVDSFVTVPLFFLIVILTAIILVIFSSDKFDKAELIRVLSPKKFRKKFSAKIEFVNALDAKLFFSTLPLFILQEALLLLQFAVLIYAFGGSAQFWDLVLAALLVFFSKSFFPPVTVGDLGVREAMAIFFFGLVGVPEQTAFNAAMFLFVINLLLPSLISLYYLKRD